MQVSALLDLDTETRRCQTLFDFSNCAHVKHQRTVAYRA